MNQEKSIVSLFSSSIESGSEFKHKRHGYIVYFKCMVNSRHFRSIDDFIFLIDEFELVL